MASVHSLLRHTFKVVRYGMLPVFLALAPPAMAFDAVKNQLQPLPPIPEAELPNWQAVGRLNSAGLQLRSTCSGVLVTPEHVLTAAHCVIDRSGRTRAPSELRFVAGWHKGDYAALGQPDEVFVHPDYRDAHRMQRVATDLAIVRLSAPVPTGTVAPLPLSRLADPVSDYGVLGYMFSRSNWLSGRLDCKRAPGMRGVITLRCPVISGNSGGPIVQRVGDRWAVVGVTSARVGAGETTLTLGAEADAWVVEQINGRVGHGDGSPDRSNRP